jgi:hypothetical protein
LSIITIYFISNRISFGNEKANSIPSSEKRATMKRIMKWYCGIGCYFVGVFIKEEKHQNADVYKKWLGPNFKLSYDIPTSVILTNHTGWFEVQYLMYRFAPGFISKLSNRQMPFVGEIADFLDTLWVDLRNRQEAYISGKILAPLIVFPEGTTTTGHHIIKLRKGAFELLQPLKSFIINSYTEGYDLGEGITSTHWKGFHTFATLYHKLRVIELPVIYPTDYMYENYQKLHPEITGKSEIYADVMREIWCEVGGFQKSDKGFKDYVEYLSLFKDKKVHVT